MPAKHLYLSGILRRSLSALFTLWLTLTLTFFALRLLPGSAVDAQFAQSGASQTVIDQRREALGLDKSIPAQYRAFLVDLSRGHLGDSLYSGQTVTAMMRQRLPGTLELATWSLLLAIGLGVSWGILAGLRTGYLSQIARLLIDLSVSLPVYWTGTLVLFVLVAALGGQRQLIWPVLVLGFHTAGAIARLLETEVHQITDAPFVRTARAKGLPERLILFRHILRPTLAPVLQVIALQTGILLSGTVITETLFSRPGLGLMLWNATLERDYPVVQGIIILIATFYITLNALADILAQLIDPRMRVAS